MGKMHRRTAIAWAVPLVLAGAGLSGCGSSGPDTLKIGVLVPLSGSQGLRGKDLLNGTLLAADEINAGTFKVNGKPIKIEVTSFDDKTDLETAKKGAQTLMDGGATVIIGSVTTPETAAVIPMIAARGLPHLFTSTTASLNTLGNGNTFRLLANDTLQGRAMGIVANQTLRAQRIAVLVEAADYGRGLYKPFAAALHEAGKQIAVTVEVDTKGDVTPEMAKRFKASQADVIVVLAREQQIKSLFKALSDVEYTDVAILGSNAVRNKNLATGQVPVRAFYATASAIDAVEFPSGRTFLTAFANKFNAEPVWGAHYAYDAVYAVVDAARRSNSVAPRDIIAKLKAIEPMAPVNQQMRFDPNGEQVYAGIAVYKVERGRWLALMRSNAW